MVSRPGLPATLLSLFQGLVRNRVRLLRQLGNRHRSGRDPRCGLCMVRSVSSHVPARRMGFDAQYADRPCHHYRRRPAMGTKARMTGAGDARRSPRDINPDGALSTLASPIWCCNASDWRNLIQKKQIRRLKSPDQHLDQPQTNFSLLPEAWPRRVAATSHEAHSPGVSCPVSSCVTDEGRVRSQTPIDSKSDRVWMETHLFTSQRNNGAFVVTLTRSFARSRIGCERRGRHGADT